MVVVQESPVYICCIIDPWGQDERDKKVELHVLGYTEHTAEEGAIHSFCTIRCEGPGEDSRQKYTKVIKLPPPPPPLNYLTFSCFTLL